MWAGRRDQGPAWRARSAATALTTSWGRAGCRSSRSALEGLPAGYVDEPVRGGQLLREPRQPDVFDNNVYKCRPPPRATTGPRADAGRRDQRVQQGVAYFHAGVDTAAQASRFDNNSYDSGDWFNRLDWSTPTITSARPAAAAANVATVGRCSSRCWPTRRSSPRPRRSPGRATSSATCSGSAEHHAVPSVHRGRGAQAGQLARPAAPPRSRR